MWIALGIVAAVLTAFIVFIQRNGGFGFPWL